MKVHTDDDLNNNDVEPKGVKSNYFGEDLLKLNNL
jgi:hypothetical protein